MKSERAMHRLVSLVERHPIPIAAMFVIAAISAICIHVRWARYDFTYRTMAPKGTPEFAIFEEFIEEFGNSNEIYIIAFGDEPLLTNENLAMVERITARIEALDATHSVISLTNVLDIRGKRGTLEVTEFVGELPRATRALEVLRRRLVDDPVVGGSLVSRDGRTAAFVGRMTGWSSDPHDRFDYFDAVEAILAEEGGGRIEFYITGEPFMDRTSMGYMIADTARLIPLSIAVQCALLWLAFGRLRATWMPITAVLIAAALTLGALTAFGVPMSLLTGQSVLASLVIVIGLSDGVHLLSRYDEEAARAPSAKRKGALRAAMTHVGGACVLTSATTAIGLLSLGLAEIPGIRDFGLFGALGIGLAFACAMVLLPCMVVLAERRRPSPVRPGGAGPWLRGPLARIADLVVLHPRSIIASGVALLVVAAVAVSAARIDGRFTGDLKDDDPTVLALRFLERNLGGAYPLEIMVRGDGADAIKNPELLAGMETVRSGLEALATVSKVTSPVPFIKKMNRAMNEDDPDAYRLPTSADAVAQYLLLFEMAGSDAEFERLVDYDYSVARMTALTKDIPPEEYEAIITRLHELADGSFPPGVEIYESGDLPLWHTVTERLVSTLLRSLYFAMPLVFAIIALAFRSLRLGLLSALPNVLPLTVGLGALGLLDIPLRFSTIVAFPLAFGLAIDDTIHFLTRYRAELSHGRSPEQAVATTINTTGRAIVLTTVFLVAGYCVLFVSNFLGIVHVAVLVCVILIAALFGDLLVLPALLLVLRPATAEERTKEAARSTTSLAP